jgi:hypothetical protein
MLNYWLGCAKYWLTSDYQFSTRDDYTSEQWSFLLDQPKQTPWYLCLPKSEIQRLSEKYRAVLQRESDPATLPDTIIVGLERNLGLIPNSKWYRGLYTNELFSVFIKNPGTELSQVSDSSSP